MIVRPYLCLVHFPRVQIAAPQSTVHSWSRTPPSVLLLTKGGGSDAADTFRADLDGARKGTLINGPQWIPDPPRRSIFNGGGGGGPELIISLEQIWTALNPALRSTVHSGFRTPPSVLPLTGGGGSGIKNKQRADLNGYHTSAPIDGSWSFLGPP
jgi:hypothetical protein